MRSKRILTLIVTALFLVTVLAMAGCKSSGMAVTSRGQLLKINIEAPSDLPEAGEGNLDIALSNRGVNNVRDVLVDVEVPPQVMVLDETHDRGMSMSSSSGVYHYVLGNVQPGETANVRLKIRTLFGTMSETGSVRVTAWQRDLPGDKLIETKVIKLRR
jgi:hypothetical protein